MEKVELLAPAGNYQAFAGALNAGADAVYLGGNQFGARAYADNFTQEEICKALHYAHIFGKKIYLTVNTLVKESEFPFLYDYIAPFYEAGLDGAIVQDLGVWQYLKETFPDMALHASTQMMITGTMGALFLKEMGASRIVPARELSFVEIKDIKAKTGLELECFIHGAMCYSYSGGCLFSSILGGRSGNRGRCAQPCRLPYRISEEGCHAASEELYPLSLKDLCTIEFIPKLIEAGIDSFKIEGRMKKPEYAAGVTAIYRKYIDWYYEMGAKNYHVDKNDMDKLQSLYIRSEIQTGYYERANGKEMITLQKPGYLGSDEELIREIAETYLQEEKKVPIAIKGVFRVNEPALLQIEGSGITQITHGEPVQPAVKRSMLKEDFLKQLRKTGRSHVQISSEEIVVEDSAFMPVAQLNTLRRDAIAAFENKIIESQGFMKRKASKPGPPSREYPPVLAGLPRKPQLHVSVQNEKQLETVCRFPCDRIYIESDFYMDETDWVSQYLDGDNTHAIYLALPHVARNKERSYFQDLYALMHDKICGFLVRNIESAAWVLSLPKKYDMVTDTGIYCFNRETARFWGTHSREGYLPLELNKKECLQLLKGKDRNLSMAVYSTIPMMMTANCLKKTTGSCFGNNRKNQMYLIDRYQAKFPVLCNCRHCYNIIYNSVPYSLHKKRDELFHLGLFAVRLDFLWETEDVVKKILDFYTGHNSIFPIAEYTTGHYKRGVE